MTSTPPRGASTLMRGTASRAFPRVAVTFDAAGGCRATVRARGSREVSAGGPELSKSARDSRNCHQGAKKRGSGPRGPSQAVSEGAPHGCTSPYKDRLNRGILDFVKG